MIMRVGQILVFAILVIALMSCDPSSPRGPISIRLIELYKPGSVEDTPSKTAASHARTEWRFDAASTTSASKFPETNGWEPGPTVSDLRIENGFLTGKAKTYFPLLHVERKSGLDDRDVLHSIQIRMRVSAGTRLSAFYEAEESIDLKKVLEDAKDFPWEVKTKLTPGNKIQTYTLTDPRPPASSDIKHLLIRPTDVEGATFEIESIRLIFRKEYLAEIPSGVQWQGLSQIYHETIVSHSPEKITFETSLPERPWIDLPGAAREQTVTQQSA